MCSHEQTTGDEPQKRTFIPSIVSYRLSSRVRRASFQAADPDGFDETLSFYDADVTDDQMNQWLATVRAGVTLLVMDSCFSGEFSKDIIITAPGRMGLFSSEEDVTSTVADKFRAGGFLAQFIGEAVGDHLADEDGDGETTAVELSQYLRDRYRADVKSGGDDTSFVLARMLGYQHLVVDRGGVGPYDVLFRGMRRAVSAGRPTNRHPGVFRSAPVWTTASGAAARSTAVGSA